jgi:hypothetical protein
MLNKFPTNHIVKIGIVVRDIEKTVKAYADLFNAEVSDVRPPRPAGPLPTEPLVPGGKVPSTVFRGKKGMDRIKTATVKLEPIYLELAEPVDDFGPWHEWLEKNGPGVYWIATESPSGFSEVEELMARKGMPIYHRTEKGTQRYGYFDPLDQLGVTLEFKELDT